MTLANKNHPKNRARKNKTKHIVQLFWPKDPRRSVSYLNKHRTWKPGSRGSNNKKHLLIYECEVGSTIHTSMTSESPIGLTTALSLADAIGPEALLSGGRCASTLGMILLRPIPAGFQRYSRKIGYCRSRPSVKATRDDVSRMR